MTHYSPTHLFGTQERRTSNSISYILPTCGRSTLERAIKSIKTDNTDEIIIVGDGPQPSAEEICRRYNLCYLETEPNHCSGNAQRNMAMSIAKCEFLAFLDDDDIYLPNASRTIKERIVNSKINLFRIYFDNRMELVLWENKSVRLGNITSQMIVIPNTKGRIGAWPEFGRQEYVYSGDFYFLQDSYQKWGKDSIIWHDKIIAKRNA